MEKFNLKKAILENKATFFSSLNEGNKEYYKDAEADDAEHIDALEKDMEDDKKSSKMKMSEFKAKIKEMVLAEMNVDVTDDTAAYDFLAEADEEVAVDDTEVAVDGEENIDVDTTTEVDPNVKAVQDALTQAQAAAQKLGDPKLTDQIGNTITFFTRAHVVDKGAVAEGDEMEEGKKEYYKDAEADDAEHIKALEKDMEDDKKSSELKETLLLQKLAGIITESQYRKKLKEAEEVSPEQAVNQAMKALPQLEKSPEIDKLADKIANDPKMLQQLEKALSQSGISMNENIDQLDTGDLKTLALNLAKKADAMNEGISNNPDRDDVSGGITMAAFFGGGTLGASLSSIIGAAIPAATTLFAGPAIIGAAAGVGLWLLARKVYLKMNPDV